MQFAASDRASRINDAVFRHHSNAVVSIDYAEEFAALFDDAYHAAGVGLVGMASSTPIVLAPAGQVPPQPVGRAIVVNGAAYLIAAAEPDGAGAVRLLLELP